MPPIQGDAIKRQTSLPAGHDDSAPFTPQDLADSTLRGLGLAAKYFVSLLSKNCETHPHAPGASLLCVIRREARF